MSESLASLLHALWVMFGIALIISGLALFLIGLFYILTFWIRMLIDCINRDFAKENDKIVWILVIVLLNWLGAILYYFCVKNKR